MLIVAVHIALIRTKAGLPFLWRVRNFALCDHINQVLPVRKEKADPLRQ